MPLFDYICNACGRQDFDVFAKPEDIRPCACGSAMERKLPTWSIKPDIEAYWDENMGHEPVYVSSRRQKNRMLKERGLIQK